MVAAKVVLPMAMTAGIGVLLRVFKISDRDAMKKVDQIIYNLLMPLLMFYNIYNTDFTQLHDMGYILYGVFGLTVIFVFAMVVVPKYVKEPPTAAAYGQVIIRPNYLLFGSAVAQNIYGAGNIGLVMLMGAVAVPVFNSMSAIILEAGRNGTSSFKKLMIAVLKNPTTVATVAGLAVNFSGFRIPDMALGVVKDLSAMTTPLSFLSIGVSLNMTFGSKWQHVVSSLCLRLIVIPAIFVLGGVGLGYTGPALCSLLILFGAPTAVSGYPMAVAMDADGEFAAQMVAMTSIVSLVTIFLWTLLLNSMSLL